MNKFFACLLNTGIAVVIIAGPCYSATAPAEKVLTFDGAGGVTVGGDAVATYEEVRRAMSELTPTPGSPCWIEAGWGHSLSLQGDKCEHLRHVLKGFAMLLGTPGKDSLTKDHYRQLLIDAVTYCCVPLVNWVLRFCPDVLMATEGDNNTLDTLKTIQEEHLRSVTDSEGREIVLQIEDLLNPRAKRPGSRRASRWGCC